ncbi:MAG: hypothetical protein ACFFAU_01560 [Candidatus Hodarchaeota archaeon]
MKTIPLTVGFNREKVLGYVRLSNEAIDLLRKDGHQRLGTAWLHTKVDEKTEAIDLVELSILQI